MTVEALMKKLSRLPKNMKVVARVYNEYVEADSLKKGTYFDSICGGQFCTEGEYGFDGINAVIIE